MRKLLSIFLAVTILLFCLCGCADGETSTPGTSTPETNTPETNTGGTSIQLQFNNDEVIVDLYDNAAAKDFASLLPLTLVFDDYNSSEKTTTLPNDRRLDTFDAPNGYDPSAGELGYYAPWGNIVIYHRDFSFASGIVPLGKFRSGEEKFTAIQGKVTVRFELHDFEE